MNADPISFLVRPHCPRCKGVKLRTLRSVADQGDGTTMRRVRCLSCLARFTLVLEPPNFGNDDCGDGTIIHQ